MRNRLIGLSMFAAAMLGAGAASAGPIINIGGINIETGLSAAGTIKTTETSYENLVTTKGDVLSGIFAVGLIQGTTKGITYTYGQNSLFLHGIFDGFVLDTITPIAAGTKTELRFTGGSLRYYVTGSDTFTFNSGSQATDFAGAGAGTLWLSFAPATLDALGHTLVITIDGSDLSSFGHADALAWLDVNGGLAATAFNTNFFTANAFSGPNDAKYEGTASSGSTGDFAISGSNDLKANAVPEPLTLSLFGAGLAGAAALRRRKAKKA